MSLKWDRFAGDTDVFAVRVTFSPDPHSGAGSTPDEAASWGSIQLWANGKNLCSHVDQGENLHSAHWYLLPIIEWLCANWNPLLHEERLPIRNSGDNAAVALTETASAPLIAGEVDIIEWDLEHYNWRSRHALRMARCGGLLPNVIIRRCRDLIEISWDDELSEGTPTGFRFTSAKGAALVRPHEIAEPLHEVLSAAVGHLSATSPSERTRRLAGQLQALTQPGQFDSRAAWLVETRKPGSSSNGSHTDELPQEAVDRQWSDIVRLLHAQSAEAARAALTSTETPLVIDEPPLVALLFSSLSPSIADTDIETLTGVLTEQYTRSSNWPVDDALQDCVNQLDLSIPDWEQGYELAEAALEELEVDLTREWVDVHEVLQRLGIRILSRKLSDQNIRACSLAGPHHLPTVVHNENSPFFSSVNARRFNLAHELCHLLFDQSRGRKLAIASGPWAPKSVERRANAFAAMFLMPTEIVGRAVADLSDPVSDLAGIQHVAGQLQVSRRAAIDHLYNMTLMTEAGRDELRRGVTD